MSRDLAGGGVGAVGALPAAFLRMEALVGDDPFEDVHEFAQAEGGDSIAIDKRAAASASVRQAVSIGMLLWGMPGFDFRVRARSVVGVL